MIKVHLQIPIPAGPAKGEALSVAVTVVAADTPMTGARPVVVFGFPGGGYNRHYFDLQLADRPGSSQAEHHAGHGIVFVACDHIGIGDSAVPEQAFNHSDIAAVNAVASDGVLELLQTGAVHPGIPAMVDPLKIGIGQSYGGLLLTVQQAEHATFDAVAMLGWSAICTTVASSVAPEDFLAAIATGDGLMHPYRRSFHFDDVPDEIVAVDLAGYPARIGTAVPPWGTAFMPGGPNFAPERGPLGPNVVVDEAAAISVPVLIVNGEVDVCPDPRAEPAAYRSSNDVTTFVLERSSHMHNFASTREQLWTKLESWIDGVARLA